ncbi:hypothetical protein DL89DRAFT_265007, partial [Linderina pennispora]
MNIHLLRENRLHSQPRPIRYLKWLLPPNPHFPSVTSGLHDQKSGLLMRFDKSRTTTRMQLAASPLSLILGKNWHGQAGKRR